MPGICEPGEPGFSEGVAAGFLLRVALGLLDTYGPGLELVNAIRDRFPGATIEQAGRWATWASGAREAGSRLLAADPSEVIFLDTIPTIPGSGLWADNPLDRWRVDAVVSSPTADGGTQFQTVQVFGDSQVTVGEILAQIYSTAEQQRNQYESQVLYVQQPPAIESLWFVMQF